MPARVKPVSYVNRSSLRLADSVWQIPGVVDLTDQLRAAIEASVCPDDSAIPGGNRASLGSIPSNVLDGRYRGIVFGGVTSRTGHEIWLEG